MQLYLYIDPAAGSLLIQAVIAAIVVVPFFLRTQIRRAIDRLRGRPPVDGAATSDAVPTDDVVPPAQP